MKLLRVGCLHLLLNKIISLTAKKDLSTFINQRITGNNVIKFEIDYYTGTQYYMATNVAPYISIALMYNNNNLLFRHRHNITQMTDFIQCSVGNGFSSTQTIYLGNSALKLPVD